MSEKLLDGPDIRAISEQRGGERMSECMGGNVFYDARLESALGNRGRDEVARQPYVVGFERLFFSGSDLGSKRFLQLSINGFPVFVLRFLLGVRSVIMPDEERSEVVMTGIEIFGNPLRGPFGKIDDTNLSAFSTNGEFARFEIDTVPIETGEFRDAEPGRIDAFENREIPLILDVRSGTSVKETFDLINFQKRHVSVTAFREFDGRRIYRRFAAFLQEFQKRPDGNHVSIGRGRGKSFLNQKNAKTVQIGHSDVFSGRTTLRKQIFANARF